MGNGNIKEQREYIWSTDQVRATDEFVELKQKEILQFQNSDSTKKLITATKH